jgi:6-pyruvoyltetrahydropterin/6-carboxytetrahydropterin synthase
MYEVEIEVTFDAAHRLPSYEGKCHFLHGHRFTAIVCIASSELKDSGFVIDFVDLKKLVKGGLTGIGITLLS